MKQFKKIMFIVVLILSQNVYAAITIHMIGDSTMANKRNPEVNPEFGWGQVLQRFFDANEVTVRNYALNGRSTKSFIDEGHWDKVLAAIQPGDYVFIQFGHNDQKNQSPERYTNPYTGYRRNLIRYVRETRLKAGVPILFSSIVRRNFNDSGVLEDTHGVYPFMVRDVAREFKAAFVDMQLRSEDLVLSLGQEKSKTLYLWLEPGESDMYPDGKQDNTHFTEKGAMAMAGLAIEGLKEHKLALAQYIK